MGKIGMGQVEGEPFNQEAWTAAYKTHLKESYRVKLMVPPYGMNCTILEYKRWRYEVQIRHFYEHPEAVNADYIYEVLWELLDEVNDEIASTSQGLLWGENQGERV